MGAAARNWLLPGQCGKVLAAVSHTTYLLTDAGELAWLATPESPKHRRCIQWPAEFPRLTVDSLFTIRGHSINFGSGTELDLRASHVWESPAMPAGDVIQIGRLPDRMFAACELFLTRETPVGVGTFIRPVLQTAKNPDSDAGFRPENIPTMKAWPVVERIARACLGHDLSEVLKEAEALVGLGEGLTPSGDDFLGGLFFTRYLLASAYPNLAYLEIPDLAEWIEAIQPRTNLISFVLLKDNVSGHALEPLNRFGVAVLTNQPLETARKAASDLIQVGHSTGWSLLTGFLVGMLLAFTD